jgi:signal transduction histidine kinase
MQENVERPHILQKPHGLPKTSKGLQFFKYSCLGYSVIEVALIGTSASSAIFLQFLLCVSSIGLQAFVIIGTLWLIYKSHFKSFKIVLYISATVLLGAIVLYPIISAWNEAAIFLCSPILEFSKNSQSISNCQQLLKARGLLKLVLLIEIALRCVWLALCVLGYRFKINLMELIKQIKHERKLQRERELAEQKERERRRKERRRKELKDKILSRQ